jgi:hypothetical protein
MTLKKSSACHGSQYSSEELVAVGKNQGVQVVKLPLSTKKLSLVLLNTQSSMQFDSEYFLCSVKSAFSSSNLQRRLCGGKLLIATSETT